MTVYATGPWTTVIKKNLRKSFAQYVLYKKNNSLISQAKHMLWVLKRTISMIFLIFLFLKQNICCGYSKEPSQ